MGLLGYSESDRQMLPHYNLLKDTKGLSALFRQEASKIYSLPQHPPLLQLVQTGASVLKTIFCNHRPQKECAACDPIVYELA